MVVNSELTALFAELDKPLPKSEKAAKRPIWTIDAETDPFKRGRVPKPFIWGVYTGEEYHEFFDTEEMIVFVSSHRAICYAHNGGKFDWHFITDYIDDFEPLTIIAGRLAKFQIGEAEFRDSYNIIPAPLSAYKKDDIDYGLMELAERQKPENMIKIREYLKTDCIYLHEMITAFNDEYGVNITQASAAMKFWAKLTKTKKPNSSPNYYMEMAKYYYGGRVECFEKGLIEKPFSVIDINSAYPFAMMSEHPWGMDYALEDHLPDYFTDNDISRCFITMSASSEGAFPVRTDKGLQFPSDREIREFHITGWEYLAARDTNCLRDVTIKEVKHYMEHINFAPYVDHFFALKNEADRMMKRVGEKSADYGKWASQRLFAKLFLNSLYGKFASNPEKYEEFMTMPAKYLQSAESDGWSYCKLISEETAIVNRPLEDEKRRYYDVAVAASITGFVRAYLWRNIKKCSGVLYCDTDCIVAHHIGNTVPITDKLGDWDLEAECVRGAIAGKKLYAFEKKNGKFKIASKGVRLDEGEIYRIAQGETVTYEPEAPTFTVKGGVKFTPRSIRMIEN
jgi:hypothetical protein